MLACAAAVQGRSPSSRGGKIDRSTLPTTCTLAVAPRAPNLQVRPPPAPALHLNCNDYWSNASKSLTMIEHWVKKHTQPMEWRIMFLSITFRRIKWTGVEQDQIVFPRSWWPLKLTSSRVSDRRSKKRQVAQSSVAPALLINPYIHCSRTIEYRQVRCGYFLIGFPITSNKTR